MDGDDHDDDEVFMFHPIHRQKALYVLFNVITYIVSTIVPVPTSSNVPTNAKKGLGLYSGLKPRPIHTYGSPPYMHVCKRILASSASSSEVLSKSSAYFTQNAQLAHTHMVCGLLSPLRAVKQSNFVWQ